jgi:hypothetical protein
MGVGGVVVSRPSALTSTLIVLALILTLALAGCADVVPDNHLPRLHASNLRYLSALTSILDANSNFHIAADFEQHGSTEPQVLTFYHNNLELTGLDGRGDRLIPTDGSCAGFNHLSLDAAVSPDGLWAVCEFESSPASTAPLPTYYVDLVSLRPHGAPAHYAFELGVGGILPLVGPAWSPDGRYLAAVGKGCAVEIFAMSPEGSPPVLVGSVNSDALAPYSIACGASTLSWSPDSTYLRLGGYHVLNRDLTYALDDHISLAQMLAGHGTTVQIPAADFTPFSAGEVALGPVWRPGENTAVVVVNGTNRLLYYTGPDQPPQILLTMPDDSYHVLGAAWTPDGRQLILTIGTGPCYDKCTPSIPDVYLLTPMLST